MALRVNLRCGRHRRGVGRIHSQCLIEAIHRRRHAFGGELILQSMGTQHERLQPAWERRVVTAVAIAEAPLGEQRLLSTRRFRREHTVSACSSTLVLALVVLAW